MTSTAARNPYIESLLAGQSSTPTPPESWLAALRAGGLERANALTVPTTRDEAWRFTDLSPLYRLAFRPAQGRTEIRAEHIAPYVFPASARLVFVDGTIVPTLCAISDSAGLVAISLAAAAQAHPQLLQAMLGKVAPMHDHAFRAINTACLHDGACVIASQAERAAPVHLLFLSTRPDIASHPRVLVIAQPDAQVDVIEEYASLAQAPYFVNAVTELVVESGARLGHVKIQDEHIEAFHLASIAASVARDARLSSVAISLGARISRNDLEVVLSAQGAHCELDGLAAIGSRQLADTHSFIDHAKGHCTSRQLHKCVIDGTGHGVFNGRVLVRQDAQQTRSAQESRNLLLSSRAHIDTKPQLEILADDVKCSHGATVGQLDAEELFYLRSRGIDEDRARSLLTFGFAAEIVDRIPVAMIAHRLRRQLLDRTGFEIKVDA